MKKILLLSILLSMTVQASTTDVIGQGQRFIKVTESDDKHSVKYELCWKQAPEICNPIGTQGFYSKRTLLSQLYAEKVQVVTSASGALALMLVTVGGGAAIGGVFGGIAGLGVGGWAGASAGTAIASAVDPLNPVEQYKQLSTLAEEVMDDIPVYIDYDSEIFAQRLEAVLDNID